MSESKPKLEQTRLEAQVPITLAALQRYRDLTDAALAAKCGLTTEQVRIRRSGRARFDVRDFDLFSAALDVPPHVFLLPPREAVKVAIEHDETTGRG